MGGKASAKSKNAWNARNYDRINVTVPKGQKDVIRLAANKAGMSLNGFICAAVSKAIDEQKMETEQ